MANKKYQIASSKIQDGKLYSLEDAVVLVKQIAFARFDESVDLSLDLNLKKGTAVRDTVLFPHVFQKEKRILVFAEGLKAKEAQEAGATYVGSADYAQKIKDGWLEFDVAIATPDMMKEVGRLGTILGKKGLMPTPKTGTITMDLKNVIDEFKKGKAEYRADKTGVINVAIGRISMDASTLLENLKHFLSEVHSKKPADAKGLYFNSVFLSSTMGPGIQIDARATMAL